MADEEPKKKEPFRELKVTKVAPKAPEKRVAGQNKGSPKAQRSAARLAAVQVLYQMRLNNQEAQSALREYINHRNGFDLDGDVFVPADEDLLQDIISGVQTRWTDIDDIVTAALAAGGKNEVEPLLDAVLRAGTFELLAHGRIDTGIIIHDYLNVTAGFYDGSEPKLVNAILDKVAKTVRG